MFNNHNHPWFRKTKAQKVFLSLYDFNIQICQENWKMKTQIKNSVKKYSLQFDLNKKSATKKMFQASCCTDSMKSFFNLSKIEEAFLFLQVTLISLFYQIL